MIYLITIIKYNLKAWRPAGISWRDSDHSAICKHPRDDRFQSRCAAVKAQRPARKQAEDAPIELGELSELLGYTLKRAQLKIFEDFLRCMAPLQLTPAQFSVLFLLDRNPGRNQTEIANTLGILRPNFVAMLDGLESRELCARVRSVNDRRSHISF